MQLYNYQDIINKNQSIVYVRKEVDVLRNVYIPIVL